MAITTRDHKLLWGRSGMICAYPGCGQRLDGDEGGPSQAVGEAAHIVAQSDNGPRGTEAVRGGVRDAYENLILLCPTHHTLVDKPSSAQLSSADLYEMKDCHEALIRSSVVPADRRAAELAQARLVVQSWADGIALDSWSTWAGRLAYGEPAWINWNLYAALDKAVDRLAVAVWPLSVPRLPWAARNFVRVFRDFDLHLAGNGHLDDNVDDRYVLTRKHRENGWLADVEYEERLREYQHDRALLTDYVLELTRAANWICDVIRQEADPAFRVDKGALALPSPVAGNDVCVPQYTSSDTSSMHPYPGAERFVAERYARDVCARPGLRDSAATG